MTTSEVYYDVETQFSAEEVGGWNNIHLMRVSVAVTWCEKEGFVAWLEDSIPAMLNFLQPFDKIVSFNGDRFDARVLSYYGNVLPLQLKSFDVLVDLTKRLGHRIRLDALAQATLGLGKSADGLQALRWWKEGKVEEIARYCQQDVKVLRDVVAFGRANGFVRYVDNKGAPKQVAVQW
ncbi:MAG: ribonuclease H-like domain-containing protein [Ignavibacteriales bacterium]|nr:ribonuclease H-like domain-containing protein [Ignavibacteriales bacterium]